MAKPYFDIVVIIPLEEELLEFQNVFEFVEDLSYDGLYLARVKLPKNDVSILCVLQNDMGHTSAMKACTKALIYCDTGLVVCLGIAGGISADLRLGDVCYSGNILDVYDNSRAIDDKDKTDFKVQLSPKGFSTDIELTTICGFVRTLPPLRKSLYAEWLAQAEKSMQSEGITTYKGRHGKEESFEGAQSVSGCLICGVVSKSVIYNKQLQTLDRRILAIETESGGVFAAADIFRTKVLVVRGISDYADPGKSALEQQTKGAFRKIAARNAAAFLAMQLSNPTFVAYVRRDRSKDETTSSDEQLALAIDDVPSIVRRISRDLDDRLRATSSAYKTKELGLGYKLPVPRIKLRDWGSAKSHQQPKEIRDFFRKRARGVLALPRMYPDKGLPFVIAQDLLTTIIDDRQVIPVIIDTAKFFPPDRLAEHARESLETLAQIEGIFPLALIINPPLSSPSRSKALINAINSFAPQIKVLVVTAQRELDAFQGAFANAIQSSMLELANVSFLEIAYFLQRNFSIEGSQSEVIALRLNRVFTKYRLSAHPSLFAGMPKDMLAALLQANRRSELLQLAVDGYLSFVVAGDPDDVVLSRTVRNRFLRILVFETKVEKRAFSKTQAVELAAEFSREFDFGINAQTFIASFIEHGILHEEADQVKIALPFIDSYLLALELRNRSSDAGRYFDIDDALFDLDAFDVYAELGPADELVDAFQNRLRQSKEALKTSITAQNALLIQVFAGSEQDEIRVATVRENLDKIMEDIISDTDISGGKQNSLDIADAVAERVSDQTSPKIMRIDENNILARAIARLARATVLLGSGGEHLRAEVKRSLITELVTLGSAIVDRGTHEINSIDFDAVKEAVLQPEFLTKFITDEIPAHEVRSKISGVFEMFRRVAVSLPFTIVASCICESAGHRVLSTSISPLPFTDIFDDLLASLWLAECNPEEGSRRLTNAIKALPRAEFLRLCLIGHIMTRVKWTQWEKDDRIALLNVADEIFRPLGKANPSKAATLREIARSDTHDNDY